MYRYIQSQRKTIFIFFDRGEELTSLNFNISKTKHPKYLILFPKAASCRFVKSFSAERTEIQCKYIAVQNKFQNITVELEERVVKVDKGN